MKLLFLIPDLAPGGGAKQLLLLAPRLPRDRFRARVASLGPERPWAAELRRAGVPVDCLDWRRTLDVQPLIRLRHLRQEFYPNLVHAWELTALRALLASGWQTPPVILSAAVVPARHPSLGLIDRRLVRSRARTVAVGGPAEAERCRRAGIPADRIAEVPLGVEEPGLSDRDEVRRSLRLPGGARWLACVGPFEPAKGFRNAVWAFDILRFVHPDLHLVFIGSGPTGPELRSFVRIAEATKQVHFLGNCADVAPVLAHAEVVWVPSRLDRGLNVALEGMAAGRPVVATRRPALAEVVADGATGVLVPPSDPAALARATSRLLDGPAEAEKLGAAGRQRARERFPIEEMVRRWAELYERG
jgi:glycosyltransferase involved in cell wall biosynthesis